MADVAIDDVVMWLDLFERTGERPNTEALWTAARRLADEVKRLRAKIERVESYTEGRD